MLTVRNEYHCFGGTLGFYSHQSTQTATEMKFSVYRPPAVRSEPIPALYYLAGLTCSEETFMIKAGAIRLAGQFGLMLVAPDTSPRGMGIPGEDKGGDLGVGAGFYVDATAEPWSRNYRMFSYVTAELPDLIETQFGANTERRGVFGHSMGGHGALVAALKLPQRYQSVSAFAPIANPTAVPWGIKAFSNYLGPDLAKWKDWDASALMKIRRYPSSILIDQGLADQFLDSQLRPEALEAASVACGQSLRLRRHAAYDHSYWFIQTFIEDHLRWHAERLTI